MFKTYFYGQKVVSKLSSRNVYPSMFFNFLPSTLPTCLFTGGNLTLLQFSYPSFVNSKRITQCSHFKCLKLPSCHVQNHWAIPDNNDHPPYRGQMIYLFLSGIP